MRSLLLVAALAMAPLLGACPGPTFVVQQYAGPVRPPETIATLRINGSDAARIMTLDDVDIAVPIERDSRLHIELLPGRHRLTVQNANAPQDLETPIAFTAEPGKVYRVVVANGMPPHLWEVDRSADTTTVDLTAPPAPPPAAPAPAPVPTPTPLPAPAPPPAPEP